MAVRPLCYVWGTAHPSILTFFTNKPLDKQALHEKTCAPTRRAEHDKTLQTLPVTPPLDFCPRKSERPPTDNAAATRAV